MNKKAQGLPINTMIIAIIVIVVLVVLVMVFTGSIGPFARTIASCEDKANHYCRAGTCQSGETKTTTSSCLDSDGKPIAGLICCVKTGTVDSGGGYGTCAEAGGEWADNCNRHFTDLGATFDDYGSNKGKECCKDPKPSTCDEAGGELLDADKCTPGAEYTEPLSDVSVGEICCLMPKAESITPPSQPT